MNNTNNIAENKPASYTCPICLRVSYNHKDIEEKFCPVHGFEQDRLLKTQLKQLLNKHD